MELVLAATFLEVIWWMLIIFFWTTFIWMFIAAFADPALGRLVPSYYVLDIFMRRDLSGWAKVAWSLALILLPLLGILIYMIARPKEMPADTWPASGQVGGASAVEDITRAQQLLQSGAINQEELD